MLVVGKSWSWMKTSPVGSASTNVLKTSRLLRARRVRQIHGIEGEAGREELRQDDPVRPRPDLWDVTEL
jgi:hypothetical protein